SILIFCLMEFGNVCILYFWPNHRLGNGVAFFDSWEEAKSDEMMEMFVHYLMYWVAGVKLIFIFLLLVVLVTGSDLTKFFAVIAMILSIATYFWKLHPIISRLDQAGKITPQGYSLKLGKMIKGFLVMFSLALVFAMLSV
ncbi:MAG: hypothetical protein ACRDD4_00700, partial [Culicoidibacterales bacterium]